MRQFKYAINHLHVREVFLTDTDAVLLLETFALRNQTYDADELTVSERVMMLLRVWREKHKLPGEIAQEIDVHRDLITTHQPVGVAAERIVERLDTLLLKYADDFDVPYSRGSDVLSAVNDILNVVRPAPVLQLNEVDPEEPELRRRVIKEWKRWSNVRGSAGAKFRSDVRLAYRATCVICGEHLPATPQNSRPGVDAAHILPWADYHLDQVSNGVCLCKIHHWAFDEGLVRITYGCDGEYRVWVPDEVKTSMANEVPGFSLELLTRYEGTIPRERLPESPLNRPNPTYLAEFNRELDMA